MLSVQIAQMIAQQPISKKHSIIYVFLCTTLATLLWIPHSVIVVFVGEVWSFFFFFRYAYKTYFTALILRYLCMATMFLLYGGSFHNSYWFVPMHCPIWMVWILYGFVSILLMTKWSGVISQLSYVYEICIFTVDKNLTLPSYLDSGNLLTYESIPILFIDKKYHAYFKDQRIELIVMNSVCSSEVIRCYECVIQIQGCKKQSVYINADRNLILPFACCVLLNMNVMTTG